MSKIHLLGSRGYIGSLLKNYLIAAGHTVEIPTYRLPDIPVKSIDADIVIHLAASGGGTVHKPRSGDDDPELMRSVNIGGMNSLLSGIIDPKTKIIFVSSTAVYGKYDNSPLVNEKAPLTPVSVYGEHKVESENILKKSDSDWVILRPCGIFGPSVGNNFGNAFLNVILANAVKNKEITIFGGDQDIDTLYLLDLIHIILRICDGEWQSRETYNVGGEIVTVEKMVLTLVKSMEEIGLHCPVRKKEFSGKPAVLTDTTKLKKAFPDWDTTPLVRSMHSLVSTYFRQFE